jgi:4-aminobutyrate aminotransferase-like enzyme
LDRGLIEHAHELGGVLRASLNKLKEEISIIGDVRGLGLLNAIEIVADPTTKAMLPRSLDVIGRIQAIARAEGLLIYGRRSHAGRFGDWILVTPPLIATCADIEEIVAGLARTLRLYRAELAAAGLIDVRS